MLCLMIYLNFTTIIKNSLLWFFTLLELSSVLVVLKLICPIYVDLSFDFIFLVILLLVFIADALLLAILLASPLLLIKYHNSLSIKILLIGFIWVIFLLGVYFSLCNIIELYTTIIPNIKIPAYVYENIDKMIIKAARDFYEEEAMPAMREYVEKKRLLYAWLENQNADNGYGTYIVIGVVVVIISLFLSK